MSVGDAKPNYSNFIGQYVDGQKFYPLLIVPVTSELEQQKMCDHPRT